MSRTAGTRRSPKKTERAAWCGLGQVDCCFVRCCLSGLWRHREVGGRRKEALGPRLMRRYTLARRDGWPAKAGLGLVDVDVIQGHPPSRPPLCHCSYSKLLLPSPWSSSMDGRRIDRPLLVVGEELGVRREVACGAFPSAEKSWKDRAGKTGKGVPLVPRSLLL